MTSDGPREPTDVLDPAAQQFVLWCLEAMQLSVTTDENDVHVIEVPVDPSPSESSPEIRPYSQVAGRRFSFASPQAGSSERSAPVEHWTLKSPLTSWLFEQLQTSASPVHAAAAKQPGSVHELTTHLFTQYQVDDGHIHLAGCNLEERPFLRLSYLDTQASDDQPQVIHCYGTSDGKLLDDTLRKELQLDELIPLTSRAPRLDEDVLDRWTSVTRRHFERQSNGRTLKPIATTLIWCKYVEGKLTFSIGGNSVEVPFSGWARLLVDRKVLPPPYACPLTGQSSYHLAATDDGRISVADAIATCAQSGQRVLDSELETCAETGSRVLPEYLQICPATGLRVLASTLVTCSLCQQNVSSQAIGAGRCPACRSLEVTPKTDPQMARILDAYPKLDRWRTWKMAENDAAHVLVGKSTWKRLLVVLNKQTLDILHVAIGSRFSSRWTTATDVQRADWVG